MSLLAQDLEKYRKELEVLQKQRQLQKTSPTPTEWVNPFTEFEIVNEVAQRALSAVKEWAYAAARGEPRGLVVYSATTGNGKTRLAQCAMKFLNAITFANGRLGHCNFLNANELFQQLYDSFDGRAAPDLMRISTYAAHPLVLDDLGSEYYRTEEWAQSIFYRLLDAFYERQALLVTSNLDPDEISRKIGPKCQSRLFGMVGPKGYICMNGIPDYRFKKAMQANCRTN